MASTARMPAYMLPGVAIQHPAHLEGDASLATEILPGPPSLVSAQQLAQKRDPRKPSTAYTYLPHSDPGSTYSGLMHGTLIGHEPVEGPRAKRSRLDKAYSTGRAQRASARNQSSGISAPDASATADASGSTSQPIVVDSETYTMVVDDEPSLSRSNSSLNLMEPSSANPIGRPRRKDKGKGKEVEALVVRVKEEPKTVSLQSPEPSANLLNNNDHCSSCRSHGALVYCDGCPNAFHLWCLDPPMEGIDEGDNKWYCPECEIQKHPPKKPPPSLLSPLIHLLDMSIPVEYQLPEDIRTFFKDVGTGPKGTYVDSSEVKPPRLNRHGQLEDRDPHRLRDRNGVPLLCFRCGTSALPGGLAATIPTAKRTRRATSKVAMPETWKDIVSCDYCNLHWHLDCLDPPLPTIPLFNKKWMCPNHAERVLPTKRRIPKGNAPPIEITKTRQFNNGNIEIIHPETSSTVQNLKVSVDEVLINGRRYRVPEKVIMLDFWNKLNKTDPEEKREIELYSAMSSPLTSLSSLEDFNDRSLDEPGPSLDDHEVAQMLCNLRTSARRLFPMPALTTLVERRPSILPEPVITPVQGEKNIKLLKARTSTKSPNKISKVNAPVTGPNISADSINTANQSSTARRKKTLTNGQAGPSTRELRSQSKNDSSLTSLTSVSSRTSLRRANSNKEMPVAGDSMSAPPLATLNLLTRTKSHNVKVEEIDQALLLMETSLEEGTSTAPLRALKPIPTRARAPRRQTQKEPEVHKDPKDVKEKRGRKRKERDDDAFFPGRLNEGSRAQKDSQDKQEKKQSEREKRGKDTKFRTPTRPNRVPAESNATPTSSTTFSYPHSVPSTPSLKIRLPKLTNLSSQSNNIFINGDTSSRL